MRAVAVDDMSDNAHFQDKFDHFHRAFANLPGSMEITSWLPDAPYGRRP